MELGVWLCRKIGEGIGKSEGIYFSKSNAMNIKFSR